MKTCKNRLFMSKAVVNSLLRQFTAYLNTRKLFSDAQYAYRTNFTYETALVKLQNPVVNGKRYHIHYWFDLSVVFERVYHNFLLAFLFWTINLGYRTQLLNGIIRIFDLEASRWIWALLTKPADPCFFLRITCSATLWYIIYIEGYTLYIIDMHN